MRLKKLHAEGARVKKGDCGAEAEGGGGSGWAAEGVGEGTQQLGEGRVRLCRHRKQVLWRRRLGQMCAGR